MEIQRAVEVEGRPRQPQEAIRQGAVRYELANRHAGHVRRGRLEDGPLRERESAVELLVELPSQRLAAQRKRRAEVAPILVADAAAGTQRVEHQVGPIARASCNDT